MNSVSKSVCSKLLISMSVAGGPIALLDEYGGADIRGCESQGVTMAHGVGGGVVEHTQHVLLNNHIFAGHFGDEHVLEADGVVGDAKLAVNHVAVGRKAESVVRLVERQPVV